MIPELVDIGGPWRVLPPGVHDAILYEVRNIFAKTIHREFLFSGFTRGLATLRFAGVGNVYLDGSFVTEKPTPGDFDCCWETAEVDLTKLDLVFLDFANKRSAQKAKYGGEFFPSTFEAAPGEFFFNYFQKDKDTGGTKGILRII